jgi:hypothetical protein
MRLVSLALCTSCSTSHFFINVAPDYRRDHARISVFAVIRDGVLSRNGWAALGPGETPPFSAGSCAVAYEVMDRAHQALAETTSVSVHASGIDRAALGPIAGAAEGNTILAFSIAGRPHRASSTGSAVDLARAPSSRVARGVHAQRSGIPGRTEDDVDDSDSFRIEADLYELPSLRRVARLTLKYGGTDEHEAFAMFANKLQAEFPSAQCSGWNFTRLRRGETATPRRAREASI